MQVTFGFYLDSYEPPEQVNSLGCVVTGPTGMLDLLETRLGLGGQWPAQPLRVIQYQRYLVSADNAKRFYSRSLQVDPLAVAKVLLRWRDEWIEAGWDGSATESDSQRIRDMAGVEVLAGEHLGKELADRLRVVIRTLDTRAPGIECVRLVEALDQLPPVWQELFSKLPVRSETVDSWDGAIAAAGTDLAVLQQALLTNTQASFKGDGSFFVMKADSGHTLSQGIAGAFLGPQAWSAASTTVIAGMGGALLDEGLHAADLPISGRTNSSLWRPASQVLSLALSLLWLPLDPHRLLEFLTHPVCPVRQSLRSRLATVVANTPGIGGEDWNRTIAEARDAAIAKAEGDPKAGQAIDEIIHTWLAPKRFDPEGGAPVDALAEQCARVSRWAAGRANLTDLSEAQRTSFLIAQQQASAARTAIEELAKGGNGTLSRLQLDRLVEEVMASGSRRPDLSAECGHVHVIAEAGAAINPVDRMVWWDFSAPALPQKWPWSPDEIAQLRCHGVNLPSVDHLLQSLASTWLRPLMNARQQLILVMPRRRGQEAVVHHPMWDQIVALLPQGEQIPSLDYDGLLESGLSHPWLCTNFVSVSYRGLPQKHRWWHLQSGELLGRRDVESFSSLQDFINAPHRWVLRHKARLSPGSLAKIGEGNRQKGALLHRLFEWLFTSTEIDWRRADYPILQGWVDAHFPTLLEQEGANYLLLGKAREAEELKTTAVSAAWTLIDHLRRAGAEQVSMELAAEGVFCGGRLAGRIDMLVSGPGERGAVLDFKWGWFRYRCDELRENRQLQLAVYAVMRQQVTGKWPDQAYYILDEARIAVQNNRYFENGSICAPAEEYANTPILWAAFEETWKWRRMQLDAGHIELNIEGTESDDNSLPPGIALPVAEASDRFDDYVVLTGWPEGA